MAPQNIAAADGSPSAASRRAWQVIAGFDRLYPFHALRDTTATNIHRASPDLLLAQRLARHASPPTTVAYTHVSDGGLFGKGCGLAC